MTNQLQKLQDENIVLIFSVYYLNDCSMFFLRYTHILLIPYTRACVSYKLHSFIIRARVVIKYRHILKVNFASIRIITRVLLSKQIGQDTATHVVLPL